jgi:cobalt-zinc-cadmium efflux system protein
VSHGHTHGSDGSHQSGSHRGRLLVAFSITFTILIAEVIGAVVSGSLALLADAGHMLTDAAGLLIAWVAAVLTERPATDRRTWGFRRAEVLAATFQAALLLAVGGYVLVNGIARLFDPPEVHSGAMLVFGIIGLVGNIISMFVLLGGRSRNLNMRAAFLEVLNDALGSVAVLLAALIIATTGWLRADAVVSIVIGLLIVPRTVRLLRETISVLLETTPKGLDLQAVRAHLLEVAHVRAVHDLHATQIATGLPILTAHVVIDDECFRDGHAPILLDQLQTCVAEHFPVSVEHSTFQLEPAEHGRHELTAHS